MQTLVAEILAAWRRAERLVRELPEGTPEHAAALDACQRLRGLYRDLTKDGIASIPMTEADARVMLRELMDTESG